MPFYSLAQKLRPLAQPRAGRVKSILVYFGGVDQFNLTALIFSAFKNLKPPDVQLDIDRGTKPPCR